MKNAHVVSRSPSSMDIGFKGSDFVDAHKAYVDPNPDLAVIAIDIYPGVRSIQTAYRGEGEAGTRHPPLPPCFDGGSMKTTVPV
jgi:hypothetical protein